MRKRVFGRKLSRERDSRRALFRSLTRSLVIYKAISTTKAKAKSLIPFVEKLVSGAKKADVSAKRRVNAQLGNDRQTAEILFKEVVPKLSKKGGITRITNLPERLGDRAKMVKLEWVYEIATSDKKMLTGEKKSQNKVDKSVELENQSNKIGKKRK